MTGGFTGLPTKIAQPTRWPWLWIAEAFTEVIKRHFSRCGVLSVIENRGEIAEEILRARDYHVDIMACMRRVAVPGTPLYEKGEISDLELAKIVAVTRIAVNPKISMNVHEPNAVAMLAGVNQLYAETGSNPRDKEIDTRENRGYSIERARQMLEQYGYTR